MTRARGLTNLWLGAALWLGACQAPPSSEPVAPQVEGPEPAPVEARPPVTDVQELALGRTHSCALRDSGAVYCWGDNLYGQLGDGSSDELAPSPRRVAGLPKSSQIVAAEQQTCARTEAGEVWCWGGRSGQTPVHFAALVEPSVEIRMCEGRWSGNYICARHASGEVSCWGAISISNQMLAGTYSWEQPTRVPGLTDATGLACAGPIVCARRGEDEALCWGDIVDNSRDDYAPVTSGAEEMMIEVRPPFAAPLASTVSAVSVSSCLAGDCWSVERGRSPRVSVELEGLREVASGPNHWCTLDLDGRILCRGDADFGQLGEQDSGLEVLEVTASLVAVGDTHTCALDPQRGVLCWGNNARGQLGTDEWGEIVPTPRRVEGLGPLRTLSASRRGSDWGWSYVGVATDAGHGRLTWWGDYRRPALAQTTFGVAEVSQNGAEVCVVSEAGELACAGLGASDRRRGLDTDGQPGDPPGDPLRRGRRGGATFLRAR